MTWKDPSNGRFFPSGNDARKQWKKFPLARAFFYAAGILGLAHITPSRAAANRLDRMGPIVLSTTCQCVFLSLHLSLRGDG